MCGLDKLISFLYEGLHAKIVYDLKFVRPVEIKFVASMPEQTKTATICPMNKN